MSERGLILALQRFHDDPGFFDMVKQDPQNTIGLYDLSDAERQALLDAVLRNDDEEICKLAEAVGMDWRAPEIHGLGTMSDEEPGAIRVPGTGTPHPNAFTGDGYEHLHSAGPDRGVNRPA